MNLYGHEIIKYVVVLFCSTVKYSLINKSLLWQYHMAVVRFELLVTRANSTEQKLKAAQLLGPNVWIFNKILKKKCPVHVKYSSVCVKMEAARFSETSLSYRFTTGCRRSEDLDSNFHRRETSISLIGNDWSRNRLSIINGSLFEIWLCVYIGMTYSCFFF